MREDNGPIEIPIVDVFDLHTVPARDAEPIVEEYLVPDLSKFDLGLRR